ncbi:DUF4157 domain-containing protein, partial [Anabaena sp. CCY 0017]|uniref:eCIS core domain-containing protein n=1 Tax=Anabaena sp. CCY 0017 TaxID=3103866 RepID=UPI0039C638DC
NSIQRMDVPEEEELQMKPEITSLQRQEEPEEELQAKSILQRQEAIGGGEASTDLDTAINSARGSGQEMADNIRQPMEQAFGADFSGVKVHTDGQSDQLNQSIQARAFTTGQDVFFRQGEYNPGSRGGQELLAHELTHVVQQNGVTVQRYPQLQAKTNDLSLTKFKDSQSPFTSQSIHPFTRTEAVIQRVVTLDMLEAQRVNIEQEGTYNSTIDEDTSTTQANAVGEQWVGEHHDRGLYGPPHNYRLISQNGRRQYRPPMTKQGGKKIGQVQANFEWRRPDEENFCFNAHVTVVDAAT